MHQNFRMSINTTKLNIIKAIIDCKYEDFLKDILLLIQKDQELSDTKEVDLLAIARQPIPKTIDLEKLKKEQGYSTEKLNAHYKNMDRSIWEGEDLMDVLKDI